MAVSHKPCEFREVVKVLEEKFLPFHLGHKVYLDEPISYSKDFRMEDVAFDMNLPPWLCQPVNDLENSYDKDLLTKYSFHLVYPIGTE